MSGSKKTIVFIFSFFATILFLTILSPIINSIIMETEKNWISEVLVLFTYTLAFIFFLLFQSLIKYLKNNKFKKENTILLSAKIDRFILSERIWIYLILVLIYFVPFLRTLSITYVTPIRIVMFIISVVLIESLIRFSNNSLNIVFIRNGILISGLDIRIELPILYGSNIHNNSGFYSYNDIENYFIFPDHVELYLILDQGTLTFHSNSELNRKVLGILKQNKIPMKKFKTK